MSAVPPLIPGSQVYSTLEVDTVKMNTLIGNVLYKLNSWKGTVDVTTTGSNIALTGLYAIDGFTPIKGSRVLVRNQTSAIQNGIYVADSLAWNRSADLPVGSRASGVAVFAVNGDLNFDRVFVCTNATTADIVGTNSLVFDELLSSSSSVGTADKIQVSGGVDLPVVASLATATPAGAITAATGMTSTTGNITATAGAVNAGTTVTAGTGVIATTGGVTATAGNVVATAGNVVATVGSVSAGTTVTAGTGVIATTGGVTATAGDVVVTAALNGLLLNSTKTTATAATWAAGATINARQGLITVTNANVAATTATTFVVTNSTVLANSLIFLNVVTNVNTAPVAMEVSAITAGVSFTIRLIAPVALVGGNAAVVGFAIM